MLESCRPGMGSTSDGVDRQYKCCFIPACYNTSVTTPEKSFFEVPQGPPREDWLKAAGLRVNKSAFLLTTRFYCCSDHFEIPGDTEDEEHLKKDVVPHKFRIHTRTNIPVKKERRKWGNVVNVPIWIREDEGSHGTVITNIFEPLVSLQETTNTHPVPTTTDNPIPVTFVHKKRRPHVFNVPIWVRGEDHHCDKEPDKETIPEQPVKRPRGRPRKNPKMIRKRSVNVPIWIRGDDEPCTISSVIVQDPTNIFGKKIKREVPDSGAITCKVRDLPKIKKEPGTTQSNIFEPVVNLQEPIIKQEPPSPENYRGDESDSYFPSEDGRTPVFCSKQTLNGKHVSYVISADTIRR